jgi:ketosteroid isomerase-like protein
MQKSVEDEIQGMVDRETNAWDFMDADALVSIFHPDMIWFWPKDENAHNPVDWVCPMGRFNRDRWKSVWQRLFDTHTLIHNRRTTVKITVTEEHDGACAVVDVDTLWRHSQTGENFHWKGRACKIYTKTGTEWKLISHLGLLKYDK